MTTCTRVLTVTSILLAAVGLPSRGDIVDTSGVQGGLVVKLGCDQPESVVQLRKSDSYMVQALDNDQRKVDAARTYIKSKDLYGPVSADTCNGKTLPYVDNLVNLLVVDKPDLATRSEIMRVLVPNGVAMIRKGDSWSRIVKPRPAGMDEWTHYLHDSTNNAVAEDTIVAPPRSFQWIGSPPYSRHHDHMSSVSAVVTSGGRIFYIFDEAPPASIQLPSQWVVIARDAFNGTILWKKPIARWYNQRWPLKSGPAYLPRRLVACGDTVYVTLDIDGPLTALDAATGRVIRTYKDTSNTEEILLNDKTLYLVLSDPNEQVPKFWPKHTICWDNTNEANREWSWNGQQRTIAAVDAATGQALWRKRYPVSPVSLTVDDKHVYFHDGDKVVCLDRKTGLQLWNSIPVKARSPIVTSFGVTLVAYHDVVLFSGGQQPMYAFAADTGEKLWQDPRPRTGHCCPEDILVAGGMVWTGATAGGGADGIFKGRNPLTGQIESQFPPDVKTYWFHHRCYRAKATENYLLTARTGTEFIDYKTKHWDINHWVRGACIYGILPANGLMYAPQHPCACYLESKLTGFCALAGESHMATAMLSDDERLEKGPAYSSQITGSSSADEWPTYRCDAARSGSATSELPRSLKPQWTSRLGGQLTAITAAAGKLFVASKNTHTLYALDARSGRTAWTFTAGARVDSPPTISGGRVLFGSADGYVYCLRADDGKLIWRYSAAPARRLIMNFEQLESPWPVHGSVLLENGAVVCVAGRSMFLDGGMRMLRLDPATGKKLSETILDGRDPANGESIQDEVSVLNMPTALPDILSADDEHIYMRSQRFNLDGSLNKFTIPDKSAVAQAARQVNDGAHLFSPTGFLDDTWWHRTYWIYGTSFSAGCNYWFRTGRFVPAGRMMVFDKDRIYGYGRKPKFFVWTPVLDYHLYAADKKINTDEVERVFEANKKMESLHKRAIFDRDLTAATPLHDMSAVNFHWSVDDPPVLARAMVLADKTLVVAGPPDMVKEEDVLKVPNDPTVAKELADESESFKGDEGAILCTVSTETGKQLTSRQLDSPPVWDGMAAAYGHLYMASMNGRVTAFGAD